MRSARKISIAEIEILKVKLAALPPAPTLPTRMATKMGAVAALAPEGMGVGSARGISHGGGARHHLWHIEKLSPALGGDAVETAKEKGGRRRLDTANDRIDGIGREAASGNASDTSVGNPAGSSDEGKDPWHVHRSRRQRDLILGPQRPSRTTELQTFRRTLVRWRREILVYFDTRLTNARTEGFNNKAKLVKKRAYGYRSFRNYRLRLLNACA